MADEDDRTTWRILVVMCPDEGCMRDLQVAIDDADDASTIRSCPHCGTAFYVSLPTATD